MGCHFLLQGIFPTQEIEPRSPALQADYQVSYEERCNDQVLTIIVSSMLFIFF